MLFVMVALCYESTIVLQEISSSNSANPLGSEPTLRYTEKHLCFIGRRLVVFIDLQRVLGRSGLERNPSG